MEITFIQMYVDLDSHVRSQNIIIAKSEKIFICIVAVIMMSTILINNSSLLVYLLSSAAKDELQRHDE
jgi:hypothetical protein